MSIMQATVLNVQTVLFAMLLRQMLREAHAIPGFARITGGFQRVISPLLQQFFLIAIAGILGAFCVHLILGPQNESYSTLSASLSTFARDLITGMLSSAGI
jgi:hypothetical protein